MTMLRRFYLDPDCLFAYSLKDLQYFRDYHTVSGNPGMVNSPFGKTMSFDPTDNNYISLTSTGSNTNYDANGSYITVVCWVYPTNGAATKYILSKDASTNGWGLYLNDSEQFYLTTKGGGGVNAVSIYNTDTISLNTWNHVACVFKIDTGVIGNNLGTMYVNGDATNTARSENITPAVSTTDVRIGARNTAASEWYGYLANPMIFKRALSAQEIDNLAKGKAF